MVWRARPRTGKMPMVSGRQGERIRREGDRMGVPTPEQIRSGLERHVELWNAGDKDTWLAMWQSLITGEPTMEDPVGTPLKRGWEQMSDAWDHSPNEAWKLTIETLYVCGNEAAAVIRNDGNIDGTPISMRSIEIYAFHDDGSSHTKTYFDQPAGGEYAQWNADLARG